MSTGSILSILAYPQYGYHLVCHTGLSLVHCSYRSVGSLHTLTELCATLNLHYADMMQEILHFTRQTAADDRRLPADPTELGLRPVEGFAQHEIPVANFQETDRFQIHRAHCTGTKPFLTAAPETIGYGSRLVGKQTIEIYKDGWWLGC